jgi:glutathione S-transferase
MADIKIYSAVVCPYAHHTRLVLQEKGIDFDLIEIDLQNAKFAAPVPVAA